MGMPWSFAKRRRYEGTPGRVTFQAGVSLEVVKAYYQDAFEAAGWLPRGQPFASTDAVVLTSTKGNQVVMKTSSAMSAEDCVVTLMSEGS